MFGFSIPELVVVLLVGIVVVGPRELPELLRTAGKWVAKLQRLAFDMRSQSGIDKILQDEGLLDDIQQLRKLLRRGNVLDALSMEDDLDLSDLSLLRKRRVVEEPAHAEGHGDALAQRNTDGMSDAQREYPDDGCDCYGATSKRDDPYEEIDHGVEETESPDLANSRDGDASESESATESSGESSAARVGADDEQTGDDAPAASNHGEQPTVSEISA